MLPRKGWCRLEAHWSGGHDGKDEINALGEGDLK
jgi:hypothetical protein